MLARRLTRYFLGIAYFGAGIIHLVKPAPFLTITPHWVPDAPLVITLTGVAELAGAIGLAQGVSPQLRVAAGWGLAAYALCVWPANINHMMMDFARPDHGLGGGVDWPRPVAPAGRGVGPALGPGGRWAYHGPRMIAQPVLIWAALWCSGALDRFQKTSGT